MSNEFENDEMSLVESSAILLENALDSPFFQGMTLEYAKEVVQGLIDEEGEETALNFLEQIKKFTNQKSAYSLDDMSYEDEALDNETDTRMQDPLRVAKLVQNNTKRPASVPAGVFFDSLLGEVVAHTWNPETNTASPVEGTVLLMHQTRTMFLDDQKRPECWSKDGTVNKDGGLCKNCPHFSTLNCTLQMVALWVDKKFENFFKLSFSKTGLATGRALEKKLGVFGIPFKFSCHLSSVYSENNRGAWYQPKIMVTKNENKGARFKALRLLAELYMAFFKSVKTVLKERHHQYLERQKGLTTNLLPGPAPQEAVGVGSAFASLNMPPVENSPTPSVDMSKLK